RANLWICGAASGQTFSPSRNSDPHSARLFSGNVYIVLAWKYEGRARPESSSRQREFPRRKAKWRITMTGLKTLVATALLSTISATFALAQEPAAFQAQFPDRDVLNGGALTPAGRSGLEQPNGAS